MPTAHNRILLLEDDPDDSRRCRDTLMESGYSVTVAPSLAAAIRLVQRRDGFDLVIVDHHLPDGEGPSLIPHLRAAGIAAPVILVTGNPSEAVARSAFDAGCADAAIKEPEYHSWLPQVAEAFIGAPTAKDPASWRWGPHVLGLAVGRINGKRVHGMPVDVWPAWSPTLQSATEMAVRSLRAAGQSAIGSLPHVHLELRSDLHFSLVLRAGVFAAAILNKAPRAADVEQLIAEAAAFSRARAESGGATGDDAAAA